MSVKPISNLNKNGKISTRELTRKTAQPPVGHPIRTNVLTKFNEDYNKNMALRGLTRRNEHNHVLTNVHDDWAINVTTRVLTRKNAPPPGGHVFQPTRTIFRLI
ncbi:hypothetical protein DPMN_093251 [Dreissena polymorpha]|uniref:Uncharacterized protein n=1 Tax=Dreissena polymorpha TaxID=45954 RepID=A0A9D4L2Z7_DREPO|nr:hypothetical protein DPMN_093251 [Dreissena polymorpha]